MPHEDPFQRFPQHVQKVKFFPASLGGTEAVELPSSTSLSSPPVVYCVPLSIPFSVQPKKYNATDVAWYSTATTFPGLDGHHRSHLDIYGAANLSQDNVYALPPPPLLKTV
jgi:hypothetical protein